MSARTVDLMTRCQATIRRRDMVTGLPWLLGRRKLRCCLTPGHLGPHLDPEFNTWQRP